MKIGSFTPAMNINKNNTNTRHNQSFKAANTDVDGHIRHIIKNSGVNNIYSVCRGYDDNVYVSVIWDWYDRKNDEATIKAKVSIVDKKNNHAGQGVARAHSVKPNSSDVMSVIPGLIRSAYSEAKSKMEKYEDRRGNDEWDSFTTHIFKNYADNDERY